MKSTELSVEGAWVFEPTTFRDERGFFVAPYQAEQFVDTTGFEMPVRQVNTSRSARGVVRGIHFSDVPPGQAKYIHCSAGAILDIVVDLRIGSPTFGRVDTVELDAALPRAVLLLEGLGHGFMALSDDTVVTYLCSTPYNPRAEHGIDPFDADLAIPWPSGPSPVLSAKDRSAPTLQDALDGALLPSWPACVSWYTNRRTPVAK